MNTQELKNTYADVYDIMATSRNPEHMKLFGNVMTNMFMWMADNKPEAATEWLEKLDAVKWKNYLTPKEADAIVAAMEPKAPWTRDQWKGAMSQYGFKMDSQPQYNRCALYVTMNMIMSDSAETLKKYVPADELFKAVHDLAVDKLTDEDGKFEIRKYFSV